VSAFIETSALYRCGAPYCTHRERVALTLGQAESWGPTYDWTREYLPTGWLIVVGRPTDGPRLRHADGGNVVAPRTWIFCGITCLTESIDRVHETGITRMMQGE
jgi:hypothetical protein